MNDLSDSEKKLALLVIREMDKNSRSLEDLQQGADAVLKVFRKVTAPPRPWFLKRWLYRLLFPFSRPLELSRSSSPSGIQVVENPPSDCLIENIITTACNRRALVKYVWGPLPTLAIVRIQVLVEQVQGTGFDTIAGEMAGPFEDYAKADSAGLEIATSWVQLYVDTRA